MTNKAYDSPNEVSGKNQNEASDTSDIEQESWVNEAGQENEGSKAGEASKGSESSFEVLSHNREEANNLDFKGFKTWLGRSTAMGTDKVMRKRTIYCRHSGQYKAKNPENPGTSVRQGCQWHINLSRPLKQNLNSLVYITTLVDEHNHELSVEALQFEKLKAFTKEMQDDIAFYVKKSRHLLCIWHIKENLKKALYGKLGISFADFYSAFWKCRNAETPDAFNYYWREMVTNYPTASEYLERQLYERRKAWARGFTTMLFTLGIESTSFVESQNACIKCVLENNNTSLCELGKVMMNHVEEWLKQKQYED
ncbi:3090_t:CDS:2 [Cetraspora pellucida]|uniref:3090_t:CDS:1 n=1 Tax=Cetraspora pellucida TaxID=1433469 RepID=A0A9N9K6X4_9GLOM|nr:3090_t:CDS:2 [Cetraspora pellucida]